MPRKKYGRGENPNSATAHFQGKGIGTKNQLPPIPVRFPENVHEILTKMENRQDYIRAAVLKQLQEDGVLPASEVENGI